MAGGSPQTGFAIWPGLIRTKSFCGAEPSITENWNKLSLCPLLLRMACPFILFSSDVCSFFFSQIKEYVQGYIYIFMARNKILLVLQPASQAYQCESAQ